MNYIGYEYAPKQMCEPAYVYMILALIMLCVVTFLQALAPGFSINLVYIACQFIGIIICTLILMFICSFSPDLSWLFTILYFLCFLSWCSTLIMGLMNPVTRANNNAVTN
jgi:hypothetical protein